VWLVLKGRGFQPRRKCRTIHNGFSRAVRSYSGFRLYSLLKNSILAHVLKGRGFEPRRKSFRMNTGFSR